MRLGLAAHRGNGTTSRVFDSVYSHNYFYFNKHHAVELGGGEVGMVTLAFNRFERSGTQVSGSTVNPDANRDTSACGIYMTRATSITLMGNTSDANAGPGLRVVAAADDAVNNLNLIGNCWKRDGTGDNSASMTPGLRCTGPRS